MTDFTEKLLINFSSFLGDYSSYKEDEINSLLGLLRDYSLAENKKTEKKILMIIEFIITDKKTNTPKIFNIKNKYIYSSLIDKNDLIDKHIWILKSILSRISIYKRQRKFNNLKINEINKNGIILINNFLKKDIYQNLLEDLIDQPWALNKGDTETIRCNNRFFSLLNYFPKRLHNSSYVLNKVVDKIYDLGYSDNYIQTMSLIAKSSFWQKIKIFKGCEDIQKDCHMDTFFPSLKFWYFPYKVNKNLAFRYAKSSHILTYERMQIESKKVKRILKQRSIDNSEVNNLSVKSELEGSLRFNNKDLLKMKLNLDSYDVNQNTLLIADVSGLHSRSLGEIKENNSIRVGIHGNTRHYQIF